MWKNENVGTKTEKRQNAGTKFAFMLKYYKAYGGYMKAFVHLVDNEKLLLITRTIANP